MRLLKDRGYKVSMGGFRLRSYFILSLVAVVTALVMVSTVLWYQSDRLRETATYIEDSVESVTTAQIIRVSLDGHRRQALLAGIWDRDTRDQRRADEERQAFEALKRSSHWVSSESEQVIVERAQRDVESYFAESHRLIQRGLNGPDLFRATTLSYDRAIATVSDLIDINVAQALKIESNAALEGRRLKRGIIEIFAAIFVGLAILLWTFHRFISRPLLSLHRSIEDYSQGGKMPSTAQRTVAELREIGQAFESLTVRLNRQNEQRLTFVAAIAHDLKNPLGAIQMSLELLAPEQEATADDQRELVALMQRQVTQLRRLVDDMMDASRIEAGRLELRCAPLDLHSVVRDCVQLFSQASLSHQIALHFDWPVGAELLVNGDTHRLGQVINNLLSNAIKYSPAGGTVQVNLTAKAGMAHVAITDQGVGIAPGEIPHIFEPFRRAVSSRDQIPGVGLGLSTARKIIEAHQGVIDVKSDLGCGSTFTLLLPLSVAVRPSVSGMSARSLNPPLEPRKGELSL